MPRSTLPHELLALAIGIRPVIEAKTMPTQTSVIPEPALPAPTEVLLVSSGDSRQSANEVCWPAQAEVERKLTAAFAAEGVTVRRAHVYDPQLRHGFIHSQRMGMDVFMNIHPRARVVVAEAVWQYSHHVLAGLRSHSGPILTVANWSGQWPGLVGMLNLNGCLYKAGVPFATAWSLDFTDDFLRRAIRQWLAGGLVEHDLSHVRALDAAAIPEGEAVLGRELARQLLRRKAIMGIFDEGCMGMYNAIVEDELLNGMGIYKERLSQSALVAAMREVPLDEARQIREWLDGRGVRFITGPDPETDLTDDQILEQCRMYIAAVRMAHGFGCDLIGIQYQQGLKDMVPASDLAEGLLNDADRPPVLDAGNGQPLYPGQPLPHFNEVDECAGVDALITNRVWNALGLDPSTTLHDVRWGEHYRGDGVDDFVWLFQISGAAPASHYTGGYAGAVSERQPSMYFRLGGGTLKGVCKPGEIVWSRVFVEGGALHCDLGRASVVGLPKAETERRWKETTSQWPIMHAVLHGVSRDQFMARHHANHINVAYAPSAEAADRALAVKAAMFHELGVAVHLCGRANA
jgi:L-fucose isomerase-like protein